MKRRYLLDTGIAQDYQAGRGAIRAQVIAHRRNGHRIGICVPVLGELWSGVECSSSRDRNLPLLRQALSTLLIWPFTEEAAEGYGRIFAALKRGGRTIQQIEIEEYGSPCIHARVKFRGKRRFHSWTIMESTGWRVVKRRT